MRVRRLKYLVGINQRTLPDSTPPEYEFRYVDIGAVGRGRLLDDPETVAFGTAPSRARRLVRPTDTIVSTVRTYLRAVLPMGGFDCSDLVVSTGFAVLSPADAINPRFLGWSLESNGFVDEVVARSVGVSYPAINALEIGDISVSVPCASEQRKIADFLDAETARVDALIAKKRRMVELLADRLSLDPPP